MLFTGEFFPEERKYAEPWWRDQIIQTSWKRNCVLLVTIPKQYVNHVPYPFCKITTITKGGVFSIQFSLNVSYLNIMIRECFEEDKQL